MSQRPAAPAAPAAPTAPAAPAQQAQGRTARQTIPNAIALTDITSGALAEADAILVYGQGGIGKTTLCAWLPAPLFLDNSRGTNKFTVSRSPAGSLLELRGKLASIAQSPPAGIRSIVIDDLSTFEEQAKDHVVATRRTEKGNVVDSIEGYGWGKGWTFVYDEFAAVLADLDRIRRHGIVTAVIAHASASSVPNPTGEDFLRWEPALYGGDKKGRASVRELVKNWSDHTLFIDMDVFVQGGRSTAGGTRTIHASPLPTCVAKSRTKPCTIPYDINDPARIWRELGILPKS